MNYLLSITKGELVIRDLNDPKKGARMISTPQKFLKYWEDLILFKKQVHTFEFDGVKLKVKSIEHIGEIFEEKEVTITFDETALNTLWFVDSIEDLSKRFEQSKDEMRKIYDTTKDYIFEKQSTWRVIKEIYMNFLTTGVLPTMSTEKMLLAANFMEAHKSSLCNGKMPFSIPLKGFRFFLFKSLKLCLIIAILLSIVAFFVGPIYTGLFVIAEIAMIGALDQVEEHFKIVHYTSLCNDVSSFLEREYTKAKLLESQFSEQKEEVGEERLEDVIVDAITQDIEYMKNHSDVSFGDLIEEYKKLAQEIKDTDLESNKGEYSLTRLRLMSTLLRLEKSLYENDEEMGTKKKSDISFDRERVLERFRFIGVDEYYLLNDYFMLSILDTIDNLNSNPFYGSEKEIIRLMEVAGKYIEKTKGLTKIVEFTGTSDSDLLESERIGAISFAVTKMKNAQRYSGLCALKEDFDQEKKCDVETIEEGSISFS